MSNSAYDPVTALDEAAATGETARIFADIRSTMDIPLITSIWRGLDGIENSLPGVWAQTRPIFQSGWPGPCLQAVVRDADLPLVTRTGTDWSEAAGGAEGLMAALSVLDAYNRSNGLNLVALAALFEPPTGDAREPVVNTPLDWPELPRLLAREQIARPTWSLVRQVNALGGSGLDDKVATLWRHLAHWPALLAAINEALVPLQQSGAIPAAAERVVKLAQREAQMLAQWRIAPVEIPPLAEQTIRNYVESPARVARMVAIGHLLARSIRAAVRLPDKADRAA